MRADMHKVIVERPRHKGWDPSPNRNRIRHIEDLPKQEPTGRFRQFGYNAKELNENLAPLKRYLLKNVGRPWDDVNQEIAQRFPKTNPVFQHVHSHIDGYVEKHVVLMDRIPHYGRAMNGKYLPIKGYPTTPAFYVHPETGILCIVPYKKRPAPLKDSDVIPVDGSQCYVRENGIWYWVRLETLPKPEKNMVYASYNERYDVLARRRVRWGHRTHGVYNVYAAEKKQLSKKEIRELLK